MMAYNQFGKICPINGDNIDGCLAGNLFLLLVTGLLVRTRLARPRRFLLFACPFSGERAQLPDHHHRWRDRDPPSPRLPPTWPPVLNFSSGRRARDPPHPQGLQQGPLHRGVAHRGHRLRRRRGRALLGQRHRHRVDLLHARGGRRHGVAGKGRPTVRFGVTLWRDEGFSLALASPGREGIEGGAKVPGGEAKLHEKEEKVF